ncbi:hypothetical protein [Streptomyces achromogenes]|uniref:hypothetical protein n=1 Tax=Streptomyces achromogenes TaxID=67255 RepID=UPI003A7F7A3B
MTDQTALETTELDTGRRYLVPVARLDLPDEPDVVHLALYQWLPRLETWMTGLTLCGTSTRQGALPEGTEVTCPGCQAYEPKYQAILGAQATAVESELEQRRRRAETGNTTENGAWHAVWLEGAWRWITSRMSTPEREYAADCVAAYDRYLAAVDGELERGEPAGLRWWRETGR